MTVTQPPARSVVRGCCPHDCPDTCAWQVTVEDGVATRIAADRQHPYTRGGLCAKVNHFLEERVYHPERLLYPLRRVGRKGAGDFEQVTWDEALDDIAERLKQIVGTSGPTAVLPFNYLGTMGEIQGGSIDQRFFARLGATRLIAEVCAGAPVAGLVTTLGANIGIVPEEIVHSRFIILWGTNTIVTNLHLWPLIRKARDNGATVVVIDALKTRTAEAADWHVRPLPGTDAALALGMMHVIVNEGLHDLDYIERHTVGFAQLKERLAEYPPDRVAEITGLDADEIVRLARAYATTRPSVIRLMVGMGHHAHAAMTFRTIACLPALVGAWQDRGGGLMHFTSALHRKALNLAGVQMPELVDQSIRSINMVQLGRALTDPSLDPPIRALIVYNANPAVTMPNQNLIFEGLAREDLFTVVHEHFMTDTARYADYVLPATTQVEHLDLFRSWGQTYLSLNQPAIAPRGEALPNTELFRRLARRLGFEEPYLYATDAELVQTALASDHEYLAGITVERLQNEGWARLNLPDDFRPFADGGFPTPSGKCELFSEQLVAQGVDPLPAYTPAPESRGGDQTLAGRYPLSLITSKSTLHFLNSSYGNVARHRKAEREPLLEIHPDDAAARGIGDNDPVRVFNDRGAVRLRAKIGDRVRPGVVAMPSGWWASLSPGGASANALTADGLTDWGDGASLHDTLVEVAAGDQP